MVEIAAFRLEGKSCKELFFKLTFYCWNQVVHSSPIWLLCWSGLLGWNELFYLRKKIENIDLQPQIFSTFYSHYKYFFFTVVKHNFWNKIQFLFSDRDIQCDFNNPFWEVTDCNWVQNKFLVEDLTLGSDFDKKFTRVLATNEHKAGNYWKRESSYTGKC